MTRDEGEALTAERVGQLVDELASTADDTWDISTGLRRESAELLADQAAGGLASPTQWTVWAFEYHKSGDDQAHFVPWMIFNDGTGNMPFLRDLPDECIEWWANLVEFVSHPRAVSRLQHLLVERRHGNVGDRARRAAESYLELATRPDIDAVDAVRTALDLAARTGQTELVNDAVMRAAAMTMEAAASGSPAPGVLLGFLDIVLDRGGADQDVDSMLAQARAIYHGQPHSEDAVIARQLKRARESAVDSRQLWSDRIDVWIEAGEAADPLVRVAHFQTAVEHARASADRELVEMATAKLQTMRLEKLGFTSFSIETARPHGELERMLRPITDADDWRVALAHFARLGPMSGDLESNREVQRGLAEQFVFSRLFRPVQLGGDNLPRFTATSDKEREEYHLIKNELQSLQLFGSVVLEALVRVMAKHPIPNVADLAAHFCSNPIVPPRLGMAIGRAFARFWAGDVEAAAFTITPRIEALARNLPIVSNEGIYRIQRNKSPGQYPGLRFLLDKLLDLGMNASWHQFLLVLCAHVVGYNIRNELAHGFVDDIGEVETALLLQAAAYLATLSAGRGAEAQ